MISHLIKRRALVLATILVSSLTGFATRADAQAGEKSPAKVFVGYLFRQPRKVNYQLIHPSVPCIPRGR